MKSAYFPLLSAVIQIVVGLGTLRCAPAEITLPAIFTEHAVLQRAALVPIWGRASPEEKISVKLGSAEGHTRADNEGKWEVRLDLSQSKEGPFDLVVQGNTRVVVSDVVVGEVWLCAGQSNMEMSVGESLGAKQEVETNRLIRVFRVTKLASHHPSAVLTGSWVVANPDTVSGLTAVGYFFAQRLTQQIQRPVGLIHSSWGGTPIEAWMSPAALAADNDLASSSEAIRQTVVGASSQAADYQRNYTQWISDNVAVPIPPSDPAAFAAPDVDTTDWKTITLPGSLQAQGLPDRGVTWLRRTLTIPANRARKWLPLILGSFRDFDEIYWNGQRIGETRFDHSTSMNTSTRVSSERYYSVPEAAVLEGENTLAIRLFSPGGGASAQSKYFTAGWFIDLAGDWLAKNEIALPPLSAEAQGSYPRRPSVPPDPQFCPSTLYHGMIEPLAPYALAGALWYQGEANTGRAFQYRTALQLMINDWRSLWKHLPFYLCQLPNFNPKSPTPEESGWAELRDAQSQALGLPHTGMAVLIDVGEQDDIHPRNKQPVGDRLARLALRDLYGFPDMVAVGPTYLSHTVEGEKIRIKFSGTDGGLVAQELPDTYQPATSLAETLPLVQYSPGSQLQGFAICGADRKWVYAQARIENNSVLVWSDSVSEPVAVRYAWANNPTCNLFNASGLPAGPFRTDSFPWTTESERF